MRRRLKGVRESWRANSLPRPSEAPVIIAQLEGEPKLRSCVVRLAGEQSTHVMKECLLEFQGG